MPHLRPTARGPSFFLSLTLLSSLLLLPSVSAQETIDAATSRTVTVAAGSYDAYRVNTAQGKRAEIQFTADQAGPSLDFYVVTQTGYDDYVNPSAPSFHVEEGAENAKSFTYSTELSGLIFLVDNADVTSTGAPGTQPVTYQITVSFGTSTGGPTALSLTIAAIAGVAVFGSIAIVVVRRRRKQQAAKGLGATGVGPSQSFAGPLPPPPDDSPLMPETSFQESTGSVTRSLTPTERSMLVQSFNTQKGKAAALPVLGLVLSIVYTLFPSLVAIGLLIPALIAPVVASAVAKHRRAIAAGSVVEFRGAPIVLGTEQVANQPFYRLSFGTETVAVSPTLYSRFVQNQPNSLAVLRGVDTVISLNGAPQYPFTEKVRLNALSPTPSAVK